MWGIWVCLVAEDHGTRHENTAQGYVRAKPLAYACALPEDAHEPLFILVEDGGEDLVHIRACTDKQEKY